jgi:phage tail-like protein
MVPFHLRLKLGDEKYPLTTYNFRVTLADTAMSFAEVSGLAIEHETVTYRHGLSFREGEMIRVFRYDRYVPVTMKKGVVQGATALYAWLETMEVRNLDISLCDRDGMPAVTWHIAKALPVKLSAPTLEAGKHEVAIDTFELQAAGISLECY